MKEEGCLICGTELMYQETSETMTCRICKEAYTSNARCKEGHFVCDACHQMGGLDYIETYCRNSNSRNPAGMAEAIMDHPNIKMHGPEHHYLVPAVLITAYYNTIGQPQQVARKLKVARERAKNILGGFCGFYGNCGAGVGTGIAMSILLNSTPLAHEEWKLGNLVTSKCLYEIAMNGGPRCCKRDTYLAIQTAVEFISDQLQVDLEDSNITCSHYFRNKECKMADCRYFPG